jgi:hypothetical protein
MKTMKKEKRQAIIKVVDLIVRFRITPQDIANELAYREYNKTKQKNMKIKTINEVLVSHKVSKDFIIEAEISKGNFVELELNKWAYEDNIEVDADWEFTEESQKIYDSLDEEIQTEIDDYILEIKI